MRMKQGNQGAGMDQGHREAGMDRVTRDAVMVAMLEELAARGYEAASVSRALAEVGVSPVQFEAEFGDKDGCLLAAYELRTGQILAKAAAGCTGTETWPERIRAGLEALLSELAARPLVAQAITRSFPGIRPSAYERYVELLSAFEPFMVEGRDYSGYGEELPSEVELLAVGAAEAIIFGEIDAGRAGALPEMLPEILFCVLVPFIGPERAADEMRSAAAIG
jgi:AcrR family transcriptional regulator